jgi:MFS family permease
MTQQGKMFFGILLILSMELIDITVLNNILVDIAHSLNVNSFSAKLAITSYTISFGIFMPISVWISNRFGARIPMILALIGFIAASVLCGLSVTLPMLVTSRVFQGVFAALLLPISQTTMIRLSKSMVEVSAKIGMYTVASAAVGQLIGAFLTQYLSWRLVFFINLPVGLLSLYLILRYFDTPFEKKNIKLDLIGFIIIGSSVGCLFALSNSLEDGSLNTWIKIAMLVIPVIVSSIYFLNIRKIKVPILNFGLFKNSKFTLMSIIMFMNKLSLYWLFFAFPIYLYLFVGFSLTEVALIMVTISAGTFLSKRFAVSVVNYFGLKSATIISSFFIMCVMVSWGYLLEQRQLVSITLMLVPLFGVMMGVFQTSTNAFSLVVVKDEDKADSNVLSKALFMIATAFSISFLGMVYQLSKVYLTHQHKLDLFIWTFEYSFIVSGVIQFIASLLILFIAKKNL